MFKKFKLKDEESHVESFEFKKFGLRATKSAVDYEEQIFKEKKPFEINKNSSQRSGVSYLKEERIRQTIEKEVNDIIEEEKRLVLAEFKVKGYDEGYAEGLEKAKQESLQKYTDRIEKGLFEIDSLLKSIDAFKQELILKKENDIKEFVKLYSEKICLYEVEVNEDHFKKVLSVIVDDLPTAVQIKIRVHPDVHNNQQFLIEQINQQDSETQLELVADPSLNANDLIVETENGEIDCSLDERMKRVWGILK